MTTRLRKFLSKVKSNGTAHRNSSDEELGEGAAFMPNPKIDCELCQNIQLTLRSRKIFCSERCELKYRGLKRDLSRPQIYTANPEFLKLHSKVRWGHTKDVESILRQGCPIDVADQNGNTPLIIAVQNGHMHFVVDFLRKGARPNHQNRGGNTPLHYAYMYGYDEIIELLIKNGAQTTITNDDGQLPTDKLAPSASTSSDTVTETSNNNNAAANAKKRPVAAESSADTAKEDDASREEPEEARAPQQDQEVALEVF